MSSSLPNVSSIAQPYDVSSITSTTISITPVRIQGEMLTIQQIYTDEYIKSVSDDTLKLMLAIELAKEMLARGQIFFTKQHDPIENKAAVRARCFCVPNDEVQILSKNGY
jgi:hypothetical protein